MSHRDKKEEAVLETLKTWKVMWEIEVDADSAEHAAQRALNIQRDGDSIATVFTVFRKHPHSTARIGQTVDLELHYFSPYRRRRRLGNPKEKK